jgi:hypothetical protein
MCIVPAGSIIINTTANIGDSAALYFSKPVIPHHRYNEWGDRYNFCDMLNIGHVSWTKDGVSLNNVSAKYDIKNTRRIAEKTNVTALLMGPVNLQSLPCCGSYFTSILTVNNVSAADYGTYTCHLGYSRDCEESVAPTATPTYRTSHHHNRSPQDKAMCNPGGMIVPPANGSEKTTEVLYHKRVDVARYRSDYYQCKTPKIAMFYCIGEGNI